MKNQIDPSSIPPKVRKKFQREQQRKKEPLYVTYKEMVKLIRRDTVHFNCAADLMTDVVKVKSRDTNARDVLSSWHCWELYSRADIERLIQNRCMQCSAQFLIEYPAQSTPEKGE